MKNTICWLTFTLFASACGQTNLTNDNNLIEKKETLSGYAQGTIKPTVELTRLDSIDQANRESVVASGDYITKAFVFLRDGDSTINLIANIKKDHRIFGYAKPDIDSERLLLLSVFTNDVENNPFECKLGAYYDTYGMGELTLKCVSTTGNFVQSTAND